VVQREGGVGDQSGQEEDGCGMDVKNRWRWTGWNDGPPDYMRQMLAVMKEGVH
jgi:hypothetical protein